MAWIIVLIIATVAVAMLLMQRVSSASPEMLRKYLREGALVIDVRSPQEYRGGHVPGALNIPLNELSDQLPRDVPDKDKVLLLHCLSGMRSRNGQRQLQRLGYKNVFNLGSLHRAKQIVSEASNR